MMNFAAREVEQTDFLLFLNNDTEVIEPGWLEAMVEQGQRPEVAAVGARLLFPNGNTQHEGIVIGLGGVASNVDHGGYFDLGQTIRNCSAVTGACMLMRPETFLELGGFEEGLRVAFNDVDICLRAREKGSLIVYTPHALLYHDESSTRGSLHPPQDDLLFRERWGEPAELTDPYYNPCLSKDRPYELPLPV
jgi:GT2 family glycosyltransferase